MTIERDQYYGSESVWRNPRRFAREFLHDLARAPELTWQLFLRSVRARYRQSFTGYLWAFLPPLAWTMLFLALRGAGQLANTAGFGTTQLIVGLVFWQLFIESAQTPLRTFAEARPMLGKLRFPREALIGAALLEVGLQFLIRLPLLILAAYLTTEASLRYWWLLPVSVAGLIAAGCFVGIALLPFSLLYEDVAPALALASGFWLLITPIAYPAPTSGLAGTLASWNPASLLINTARSWFFGNDAASATAFVLVCGGSAVAAALAWAAARVAFPHLIARFGS